MELLQLHDFQQHQQVVPRLLYAVHLDYTAEPQQSAAQEHVPVKPLRQAAHWQQADLKQMRAALNSGNELIL